MTGLHFVIVDVMLDWHLWQTCFPLEIKYNYYYLYFIYLFKNIIIIIIIAIIRVK